MLATYCLGLGFTTFSWQSFSRAKVSSAILPLLGRAMRMVSRAWSWVGLATGKGGERRRREGGAVSWRERMGEERGDALEGGKLGRCSGLKRRCDV
jgi:hypothetical protein